MPVFYLPLMGLYLIKSIALSMPLLFVCAVTAVMLMVGSDKLADFIFAQAADNLNNSNKLSCNNINLPANLTRPNYSISLQNVNITNSVGLC